jgi:predicted phosphodiesterase
MRRWAVRGVLGLVALVLSHIGGVLVTDAFPARADTDHYQVEASLDLSPWRWSRIRSFTTVGDLTIDFNTPLPAAGIEARPQIKRSIVSAVDPVNSAPSSASSLVPTKAEITEAGRQLVVNLTVRYLIGVLLVVVVILAASHLRWRDHRRKGFLFGLLAGALAMTYTGASTVATYRPEQVKTYSATELLATLQSSPEVLASIESRAGQVEPYVTNWLQLQNALQERFISPEVAKADTVRFLLVSDIHGTNEYAVMKKIVESEAITAVIDTGDLLNFGEVNEGELSGLFKGIASVGVPYIFVDGNHDATSRTDEALLRRLARVKNVVLPEPRAADYQLLSIAGVRIAGMNDPRYYGDSNTDVGDVEKPAAEAFADAFKDVPDLDIVLAHEPTAADAIGVGTVKIRGHLHRAALDGNTIAVGTFTGGGLMSYYRNDAAEVATDEAGAELTGQPQAFDILRYNADCSVNSLQRLVYSDLIEGSPKYDSVTVINGSSVSSATPTAGRRCVTTEPTAQTPVAQVDK